MRPKRQAATRLLQQKTDLQSGNHPKPRRRRKFTPLRRGSLDLPDLHVARGKLPIEKPRLLDNIGLGETMLLAKFSFIRPLDSHQRGESDAENRAQ